MYADDLLNSTKTTSAVVKNLNIEVTTNSTPANVEVVVPIGKGKDATVNGYNTVLIKAEDGITLTQVGNVLTLTSPDIKNKIDSSEKGVANGVATLGADGLVPDSQLPDFGCKTLIFTQETEQSVWTITHSMEKVRPSVTIVDPTAVDEEGNTYEEIVIADVRYISNTQIEIHFDKPFAGKAYLN